MAKNPNRKDIPVGIRRQVMQRDGNACVQCGKTTDLQLDHIVPITQGGPDTTENLRVLCGKHNRDRNKLQPKAERMTWDSPKWY